MVLMNVGSRERRTVHDGSVLKFVSHRRIGARRLFNVHMSCGRRLLARLAIDSAEVRS
jgi:hypothetical protein